MQTETAELSGFVSSLLRHCLAIRAVWSVGHDQFASETPHEGRQLLLFADRPTLDALRRSEHLHRHDMQVLVVIDGDHFENAWGPRTISGSLARWAWRAGDQDMAFYDESKWADREGDVSAVVRVRRKAFLLWSR